MQHMVVMEKEDYTFLADNWISLHHCQGPLLQREMKMSKSIAINEFRTCINNYIHIKGWDVIPYPCHNFNGSCLTHWGRMMHICISKLTIIGSDNGLSPDQCQAIIWTNAGILLIQTLGTNFSEILSAIHTFSFKKMHLKMAAILSRPQCVDRTTTEGKLDE